jgi:hypothetical protein
MTPTTKAVMTFAQAIAFVIAIALSPDAPAQSFGATQVVGGLRVASIFHGAIGPTYVTFTPASLAGCSSNAGGYLSTLWSPAMTALGATTDSHKHATQMGLLLSAKATGSIVEVRYRINSQGGGWDNCAIDAIWVQQ